MSRRLDQERQVGPVGRIETALYEAKEAGNYTFAGTTDGGKKFWFFDYRRTGDLCGDRCRGAVLYENTHAGYEGTLACNQFGPEVYREAYFRARGQARPALFPLGRWQLTPGARDAAQALGVDLPRLLVRHAGGDWGDLDEHDWAANDQAVKDGTRILSSYRFSAAVTFWVITEGDRSYTTVLLPDEY